MTKASSKIKILTITPGLNVCGGIESYVMNYYSRIKNEVKMDFITHDISDNTYKDLIEKNGDNVYLFPKICINFFKCQKKIDAFFKEHHDYDIVHCHMANAAFLYLKYAKKYGIKIRIIHSHQNKAADVWSHALRNIPLIKLGLKYANVNFACSKLAGDYLFKNKKYYIINNAIDPKRFNFNNSKRNYMRKKLKIDDSCFVIGNVGRLCPQKNQKFLIKVFANVHNKINSKLLIIGDGELKNELEGIINELKLDNNVMLIPSTNKIEDYYQAMDIFVLPSLYEGLGIVNIEAQACGLKTIVSDKVPECAKISDLLSFVKLSADIDIWSNEIINNSKYDRKSQNKILVDSGYDIDVESKKLIDLYKSFI